jgi:Spy/CpxP family protein refolding chaperone
MVLAKRGLVFAFLAMVQTIPVMSYASPATSQQPETLTRQSEKRGDKRRPHDRLGFGLRQLDLSDEQKQQTQQIMKRFVENIRGQREELMQLREKRATGTLTPEDQARAKALHQQIDDARQGLRGELMNILTTDQRTRLEQFESQRKARREERSRRRELRSPVQE